MLVIWGGRGGGPGRDGPGPDRGLAQLARPRPWRDSRAADGPAWHPGVDHRVRRRGAVPGVPVRGPVHRLPGGGGLPAAGRPGLPGEESGRSPHLSPRCCYPGFCWPTTARSSRTTSRRPRFGRSSGSTDQARPGSLLVEGSKNYPAEFRNYERFTYVPIDREPPESYASPARRPGGQARGLAERLPLHRRIRADHPQQKIAVDSQQSMPVGSLDKVEAALRSSPRFRVAYDTGDAVVFVLTEPEG